MQETQQVKCLWISEFTLGSADLIIITPLPFFLIFVFSMSEDEGQESGCDTVEGSPTSDTSTSPHGNNTYRYLDNNNHSNLPSLPDMVAPPPSPAVQSQSMRSVRTMVVPPMTLQNNNSQGTEEHAQRAGQWICFHTVFGWFSLGITVGQ